MKLVLVVFAVLVAASVVQADLYMHNPPGSNDRNRERNDNRQNANRLFDSQNNAAGGYPWRGDATLTSPDPITYYKNSVLNVQWTAQHACGPNTNVHCQLIMQYMCLNDNPYLRDGYPEGTVTQSDNANTGYLRRQFSGAAGQNPDGTERIPDDKGDSFYAGLDPGSIEYGYHETIASYKTCVNTERNMGLYTADQKLQGNDARFTRQNPNGGRRGLECPEERDYYPYWRPTVWHDVAVLVSNTTFCPYYLANTENTATRGYCKCDTTCQNAAPNRKIPITEKGCTAPTVKGTWINVTRAAGAEPTLDCQLHPFSRDNHLGNVQFLNPDGSIAIDPTKSTQPETASYNWRVSSQIPLIENGPTLPPLAPIDNNPNMPVNSTLCILRLRYNMSTSDYPAMDFAVAGVAGVGFDSSKNCPRITQNPSQTSVDDGSGNTVTNDPCVNKLTATSRPLYNRPYVKVFGDLVPALSLAINTHQTGRTFQDRSYVFRVADPVVSGTIFNLNVRGRRGNIVQAYPAVEYDFTPNILKATAGDFVHIQLHGSDFNEAKNANNGEGWQFSDRSNIVEHEDGAVNYPIYQKNGVLFPQTVDETGATVAQRWAFVGQSLGLCAPFKDGDTNEQNSITNCGKLNAAPAKFPTKPSDGLLQLSAGKFLYMSTRNNNFSNRSQKATIDVAGVDGLSAGAVAGIVIGSIAGVGLLVGGVMYYGKKNPNTVAGSFYQNTAGRFMGGTSTGGKSAAPPPPDMEYQRQ